jgi:hypothetical protein
VHRDAVEAGDERDAAGVVLEGRVVEALRPHCCAFTTDPRLAWG